MAEKGFFKQVSFPESLGAEDKGKLTVSATNPQLVTILPGTPNAHTFYFQDPKNPTPAELNKIREYYGIPLDVSPQEAERQLNALGKVQAANIVGQIPYEPGTKQYYSELSARIADVNQRMKLIEDPANYYFKHLQQQVPLLDRFVPDQLVSKESFQMAGALGALGLAGLATAPTGGAGALTAKILGAEVLGDMAGGQLYELTNQMLRHLNDLPTKDQATMNAEFLRDAYMALAFTGGGMALGPIVKAFKPTVGRVLFGLDNKNPEYQKMLDVAETYGMPLGIIQATNSAFWKGYSRVIGVFPYVGTPFRRAGEGTNEAIRQYFKVASNNFAPFQTMASLGGDIAALGRKEYEDTMTISRKLYEQFNEYSEKLAGKKVIKLDTVKYLSDEFEKNLIAGRPGTSGFQFRFPGDGSRRAFEEFYRTLKNLDPDGVTIEQARTLQQLFSEFQTNFKVEGKGNIPTREGARITQLGLALEHDTNKLINIDNEVDKVIFETAQTKLTQANEYLAEVMPKYDGPIADQYRLVNEMIFSPGAQTSQGIIGKKAFMDNLLTMAKDDEELMAAMMNLAKTPRANLKAYKMAGGKEGVKVDNVPVEILDENPRLPNGDINPNFGKTIKTTENGIVSMGPEYGRRQLLRKMYDNALEDAFQGLPVASTLGDYKGLKNIDATEVYKFGYKKVQGGKDMFAFRTVEFNPRTFADNLGLNTAEGRAAFSEALKGTGTKVEDVTRFLDIAERAGSFVVTDPSAFVQRRVTLSGFKGVLLFGTLGAAGAGASALTGGIGPLMVPLLLRYGSSILTDPKVLKSFSRVLQDTGPDAALRAGVGKQLISEEDKKVLLEWANNTLPTQADLDQQDFVNQVEQSILSLMKEPQSAVEAPAAREQQMDMMEKMFGPFQQMSEEDLQIGRQLENRLQPSFNENLGTSNMNQFNVNQPVSPNARNELAFGTLDDAINQQMMDRGIGTLP